MRSLDQLLPSEGVASAWCDADVARTAVMEAVSFVTPVLERFFIRTVTMALASYGDTTHAKEAHAFMREEANHARSHRRFNSSLTAYLGAAPPGLASVGRLLDRIERWLPLSARLALVAAFEHFATVLSTGYLEWEKAREFGCRYAKALFAIHAMEEIGHRSVVFDLWLSRGACSPIGRGLAVLAIIAGGLLYLACAVPWIVHRKLERRSRLSTVGALFSLVGRRAEPSAFRLSVSELFRFARPNFHPRTSCDGGGISEG